MVRVAAQAKAVRAKSIASAKSALKGGDPSVHRSTGGVVASAASSALEKRVKTSGGKVGSTHAGTRIRKKRLRMVKLRG